MKNIVQIDGKQYINANVIMLAYNVETRKLLNDGTIMLISNELYLVVLDCLSNSRAIPQHLYITSDEEIKEGEWIYDTIELSVYKCNNLSLTNPYLRRVIATTDTSLGLPKIPQQFIEKWIEEYNKGKVITKVLVEVEEYEFKQTEWFQEAPYIHTYREYRLKLNQNEIIINSKKDSWSREEHSKSIADFSKDLSLSFNLPFKESLDFTVKWIEENL